MQSAAAARATSAWTEAQEAALEEEFVSLDRRGFQSAVQPSSFKALSPTNCCCTGRAAKRVFVDKAHALETDLGTRPVMAGRAPPSSPVRALSALAVLAAEHKVNMTVRGVRLPSAQKLYETFPLPLTDWPPVGLSNCKQNCSFEVSALLRRRRRRCGSLPPSGFFGLPG